MYIVLGGKLTQVRQDTLEGIKLTYCTRRSATRRIFTRRIVSIHHFDPGFRLYSRRKCFAPSLSGFTYLSLESAIRRHTWIFIIEWELRTPLPIKRIIKFFIRVHGKLLSQNSSKTRTLTTNPHEIVTPCRAALSLAPEALTTRTMRERIKNVERKKERPNADPKIFGIYFRVVEGIE